MELQFRKKVLAECGELAKIHCVGENRDKCILCGSEQHHTSGLCPTCLHAVNNRCSLRQCGKVRGLSNNDVICLSCGEKKATTMGLCRNCYRRMKRLGLDSAEKLVQYETEKANSIGPAVPDWNPIFQEK